MFQYVHEAAQSSGRRGRLFRKIRFWILHFYDPVVHYVFNGKKLVIPFSHDLPFTRREYPTYSANLSRLASFLRQGKGSLRMVDVGANIGDSHALAGSGHGDKFLLIEGDDRYLEILKSNTQEDPGVTRVRTLLSDKAVEGSVRFVSEGGTSRVERTSGQTPNGPAYQTLDQVLASYPDFLTMNLLKCDVDGYDSRVLVGAQEVIKAAKPVLFFEHHPHLLALAGDDDTYIFERLHSWGYSTLLFYDIKGFLLGPVDSADRPLIKDLILYAKSKEVLCYDVCCFHDTDATLRDEFLVKERGFYSDLIAARYAKG